MVRANAAEIPDGLSLAPFRCEFSIAAVIAAFFFSRVTAEAFRASALEEMFFFLPSPALDTFLRAFMACLPPVLIEVLPSMPLRSPGTLPTAFFSTPASVTPTSTASLCIRAGLRRHRQRLALGNAPFRPSSDSTHSTHTNSRPISVCLHA